jgi:hypothetical protein
MNADLIICCDGKRTFYKVLKRYFKIYCGIHKSQLNAKHKSNKTYVCVNEVKVQTFTIC